MIHTKKLGVFALAGVLLVSGLLLADPAWSQSKHSLSTLLKSTRDQGILEAFNKLSDSSASDSVDEIVTTPVRVFFKDLKQFNRKLKDFDAVSWISYDGQHVIFINKKHKNAPPEALAAIIAHEVMHNDEHNSLHEEVAAWHKEAQVWHEMKLRHPYLSAIPEGKYELVDRLNTIEAGLLDGTLTQIVSTNEGYTGLPKTSPGFESAPMVMLTQTQSQTQIIAPTEEK